MAASSKNEFDALFALALAGFEALREERGVVEHHYAIGRDQLKLCFAGDALQPLITPALEHLAVAPVDQPELTIMAWDLKSLTSRPMVALEGLMRTFSWHWYYYLNSRGELKGLLEDDFMAAFHPGPNIFSLLDVKNRRAIYWANDAAEVPWHETGSPMRSILSWWTASQGYQFAHGGAVGVDGKSVLIVGKGGSGKSTTCLACLNAGLQYLGDDYTLIDTREEPRVFSLYNTAKLKGPADLARFPQLTPHLVNAERLDSEKAMLFLHGDFDGQIIAQSPLKAILIPVVMDQEHTKILPAGPAAGLAALAPSTIFQLPGSGRQSLRNIAELVQRVPCYSLRLGRDLAGVAETIRRFIANSS
ncbi:hypothetical protein [Desulfoferula mesophila]|uniref:hypothetical protein n=1 Tax=Desulfoferula mesophila TaxID=3058419 RepID=UPI0030CD74FA